MKPLDYPLLADENIHRDVVRALLARGKDVRSVLDEGWAAETMSTCSATHIVRAESS
ncbi:hypothetical protein [Sorangium sp. So ce406]|uniref:hypothetical protein n=1 Tax=Sorangium sp. So ce406 TaxID=3133311 RepID=UPI003F5B815A